MAWNASTKPTKDAFKPAKEGVKRSGLKIGIHGPPEAGKTHFIMTAPEPVYIIDLESGAMQTWDKPLFRKRDIRIYDVLVEEGIKTPSEYLKAVERVLDSLEDVEVGTIAIDPVTQLWDWLRFWLRSAPNVRRDKLGKPYQFEWDLANERFNVIIMKLLATKANVILSAHSHQAYEDGKPLYGVLTPAWQKKTPFWLDLEIAIGKRFNAQTKKWSYVATIEKCRYQRAFNMEIEDITWNKLVEALSTLGVSVQKAQNV